MRHGFALFIVELKSDNPEALWEASTHFANNAEITYFDRKNGTLELQFISTANEEQVKFICDEFKKEVELGGGDRLTYKVAITKL